MICPRCQSIQGETARFCATCGQRLETQKTSGMSIGDIGMVRGNVSQTTIAGDVYFNETPARLTAPALAKHGVDLLKSGMFDEAADRFREALATDSSLQDAYFYLALAILKGRRPRNIPFEAAREIDSLLSRSAGLRVEPAHVYLWMCIKYDFYVVNGLNVPPPSINELAAKLRASPGIALSQLKWLIDMLKLPDDHVMVGIWR